MFGQKPYLPIDVMLQTGIDPAKDNYNEYLESWKRKIEDASATAFKDSTDRKTKDAERKLHSGPCIGILKPGRHV